MPKEFSMSRFTKSGAVALCSVGLMTLAGCSGGGAINGGTDGEAASGSFEPAELTVSSIFPPGSTASRLLDDWMTEVTEATDGAVTFDVYGDGTLHPAAEALSAMSSGLTDITFVNNGSFPEQLPVANWDDLAVQTELNELGYPNMNVAGLGQQALHYAEDNAARDEMVQAGFRPLVPMLSGPAALTCTEPFEAPDDLKGRQVRVPNAISQAENEALGMVGVFMAPNEQYEALQRGVVDCAVNAPTTVLSGGLLEVAPHVAFTNNAPSSGANWVISTSTWDSLSPELQQVFTDAMPGPMTKFAQNTLDEYRQIAEEAQNGDVEIVDAAQLNPLLAQYWADRPGLAGEAPDGVDAEAAIAQTKRVADAWRDFSTNELKVPHDSDNIIDVLSQGHEIIDWEPFTEALAQGLGT
jgi:TRAP-type C4-dicarboxylate transport system substrate-binding protein